MTKATKKRPLESGAPQAAQASNPLRVTSSPAQALIELMVGADADHAAAPVALASMLRTAPLVPAKVDAGRLVAEKIHGVAARANVSAFLASPAVSDTAKDTLRRYLTSVVDGEQIQIALAATAHSGRRRIEALWRENFASLAPDRSNCGTTVRLAAAATHGARLVICEEVSSLLSHVDSQNRFTVRANPLFVASLSDRAIADAVAHEQYHHLNRHYDDMVELVSDANASKSHKEIYADGRLMDLANYAVDAVTNRALSLDHLEVLVGRDGEDEVAVGRRLLAAAAASGSALGGDERNLRIAIRTFASLGTEFGDVANLASDSVKDIFLALLAADT